MTKNVAGFGQSKMPNKDSLVSIKLQCIDSLVVKVPNGQFHSSFDSYEEGYLYSVVYDDSSFITILCGANAELNLNTKKQNLYSRKEKVNGVTLIYENVQKVRLKIFNQAFDLILANIKE